MLLADVSQVGVRVATASRYRLHALGHGDGSGVHARLLQLRPDAALSAIVLHELLEVVVDASAALPDHGGQPTAPGQVTAALAAEVAPVVAPGHRHAARRAPGRCR